MVNITVGLLSYLPHSPEYPALISCLVGAVGVLGIIAAFWARGGIGKEAEILEKGSNVLNEMAQARLNDQANPEDWLRKEGLEKESHFGDRLISVWLGCRANRLPTLMDLHNLSIGRERRRLSARLAAGITGLLVLSGIAGTLICIHPILGGFKIPIETTGVVDSSRRAADTMEMIHGLGRAFYPSLTALLFTFAVASARGYYSHASSRLAWELDNFSLQTLFTKLKGRTFGEELSDLQGKLSKVVETITQRDSSFKDVFLKLEEILNSLQTTTPLLTTALGGFAEAAKVMASEVAALRSGFESYVSSDSPVITGLASIISASEANQVLAGQILVANERFHITSESTLQSINIDTKVVAKQIEDAVVKIPELIGTGCTGLSEKVAKACNQASAAAALEIKNAGDISHAAIISVTDRVSQRVEDAGSTAAGTIDNAVTALAPHVESINFAATQIAQANQDISTLVQECLGSFRDQIALTIGKISQDLKLTKVAVSEMVKIAEKLINRVDGLRELPLWLRRLYQKIGKKFGSN